MNLHEQIENLKEEHAVKLEELEQANETLQEARDELEYIEENKDEYIEESDFEEILDADGTVNVAGLDMYPSTILKQCDPIAYNIAWSEFCDNVDITEFVQWREAYNEVTDAEAEVEHIASELEDIEAEIEGLEEMI